MPVETWDSANPPLADLIAAHPLAVPLYTDGTHQVSVFDVLQLRSAGIGQIWVHENAQTELAGGYEAGRLAAQHAMAGAPGQAGTPRDGSVAIFYSWDANITPAQMPVAIAAWHGINDEHAGQFQAGCYGPGALIDALVAAGLIQVKGWLSAASSWAGFNPASPNVGMVQTIGTTIAGTDADTITDATALGVWWAPGQPNINKPPFGPKEEDTVTLLALVDGEGWVIAADLSSRYGLDSAGLYGFLKAQNGYVELALSDAELAPIPIVGQPSPGEAEILAALAKLVPSPVAIQPPALTATDVAHEVITEEAAKLSAP